MFPLSMQRHVDMPSMGVFRLNEGGIIEFKVPYTDRWVCYPVSMCIYGLACFENDDVDGLIRQAVWLRDHVCVLGDGLVWKHGFCLPFYPMDLGWVHGMAQALGVSVMVRAFQCTGDKGFLDTAQGLFNSLTIPVEDGGVFHVDCWGDWWVEEYGIECKPMVLNGFMTVMMSVFEYWRFIGDERVRVLFDRLVNTLQRNLFRYGCSLWSRYDLFREGPAQVGYHRLHVRQLQVLFGLSGLEVLWLFAVRWKRGLYSPLFRFDMKWRRMSRYMERYGLFGSLNQFKVRQRWLRG